MPDINVLLSLYMIAIIIKHAMIQEAFLFKIDIHMLADVNNKADVQIIHAS